MLTRRRSAVSSVNTPAEVERVRRPDHSLKRGGSPRPFAQMRLVVARTTADPRAGTIAGTATVSRLLAKPTSEGTSGDATMMRVEDTVLSVTALEVAFVASKSMARASSRLVEPSGQSSTGVAKRALA